LLRVAHLVCGILAPPNAHLASKDVPGRSC
jgi:hypothetical protein